MLHQNRRFVLKHKTTLALSPCNVSALRQTQRIIIDNLHVVEEKEAAHVELFKFISVFADSWLLIVRTGVMSCLS